MKAEDFVELLQHHPEIARDFLVEHGCEVLAERFDSAGFANISMYWENFFRWGKGHPDYKSKEEYAWLRKYGSSNLSTPITAPSVWEPAARLVDILEYPGDKT